jgi:hypothetical protein
MAVNYTGNGGVDPGTVYAATLKESGMNIAMYGPKPGGGLEFLRSWSVPEVSKGSEEFEKCGPALPTQCTPRVNAGPGGVDVDVDQMTGIVYAYDGVFVEAGRKMIIEYTPNGSAEITRFGERAISGAKVEDTPDQIHSGLNIGGMAVNGAGEVYVYDLADDGYHRLMKFRPKVPGVFTEYEYAGMGEDVGAGFETEGRRPWEPVADEAGDIYVAPDQSHIEKYDASDPGGDPVCDFKFAIGGITGITVNPKTGTPFFFSFKTPKRLYQLGACDPGTGKFKGGITGETTITPERDDLWGLAYDPVAKFSPGRPAGVLYGGAPAPVPNSAVGTGQPGKTSLGYIFAPAEELPPVVESEEVLRVTEATARVSATIDPEGSKTKYAFQYLTETAYQNAGETFEEPAEAPLEGGFLPNSTGVQSVAATLSGLAPDTAYRYRVVATSECATGQVCEGTGEPESLRTYPAEAPGLHDGRAYELVSPAQKNGGQVLPAEPGIGSCPGECKPGISYDHFPMQSAPDGDSMAFQGTAFLPGTGVSQGNEYIARRDPTFGWQTVNLTPAQMQKGGRGYQAVSEALMQALLGQVGPALILGAPAEFKNFYVQSISNPFALKSFLTAGPPNRSVGGEGAFTVRYAGATPDLSHIFFAANDVLTAADPGIAPTPENGGAAKFNLYEWEPAAGEIRLANVLPGNTISTAGASVGVEGSSEFGVPSAHPVSADGSRVFWSNEAGKVFVREDAALTKEIPDPGKFLSASTDGSKVLLNNGHVYDLETGTTVDLTGGKAGFQGISGQSDDLSQIYFVDTAVLTDEELNSEGAKAQAGKPNLYAWNEGGPTTHFVGTLVAEDNSGPSIVQSRTWSPLPSQRTAQASPGGRFLAFLSVASLTGFDNSGVCTDTNGNPVLCPAVFVYDSATGRLDCASCNRTGATPLGFSMLRLITGQGHLPQPRYMLDSGRLYFDSQDALSQFDTNDGVEDVYEFEPEGTGGCTREGGCVAMISGGRSGFDSNLLAVDASGANVFFTTRDKLVSSDTDDLIDLYDAREGGGFAFESQLPQGPCQGEGCQTPPPTTPEMPPSSQLPKEGNVPPVKCKKGQVKKNGKCVKKQKHKPKNNKKGGKAKRGGSK